MPQPPLAILQRMFTTHCSCSYGSGKSSVCDSNMKHYIWHFPIMSPWDKWADMCVKKKKKAPDTQEDKKGRLMKEQVRQSSSCMPGKTWSRGFYQTSSPLFLPPQTFLSLPLQWAPEFFEFIFSTPSTVITVLRKNIPSISFLGFQAAFTNC